MTVINTPQSAPARETTKARAVEATSATAVGQGAGRALALARIATGFVFLWAFVDKLFGLGFSTTSERAWLNGGSPTSGFLGHVEVGPFQSAFRAMAGVSALDWLFMLGMLGVGVAVILGVGLRVSAIAGSLIMILMWAAEWPMATTTSAGDPSGSTNPFVDYHLIYALVLIVAAFTAAGRTWGLGRWWESTSLVRRNPWLK